MKIEFMMKALAGGGVLTAEIQVRISTWKSLAGAWQALFAPRLVMTSRVTAYSAVVGSITNRIREIRLAGNPPCCACLRTVSSSGEIYTQ